MTTSLVERISIEKYLRTDTPMLLLYRGITIPVLRLCGGGQGGLCGTLELGLDGWWESTNGDSGVGFPEGRTVRRKACGPRSIRNDLERHRWTVPGYLEILLVITCHTSTSGPIPKSF